MKRNGQDMSWEEEGWRQHISWKGGGGWQAEDVGKKAGWKGKSGDGWQANDIGKSWKGAKAAGAVAGLDTNMAPQLQEGELEHGEAPEMLPSSKAPVDAKPSFMAPSSKASSSKAPSPKVIISPTSANVPVLPLSAKAPAPASKATTVPALKPKGATFGTAARGGASSRNGHEDATLEKADGQQRNGHGSNGPEEVDVADRQSHEASRESACTGSRDLGGSMALASSSSSRKLSPSLQVLRPKLLPQAASSAPAKAPPKRSSGAIDATASKGAPAVMSKPAASPPPAGAIAAAASKGAPAVMSKPAASPPPAKTLCVPFQAPLYVAAGMDKHKEEAAPMESDGDEAQVSAVPPTTGSKSVSKAPSEQSVLTSKSAGLVMAPAQLMTSKAKSAGLVSSPAPPPDRRPAAGVSPNGVVSERESSAVALHDPAIADASVREHAGTAGGSEWSSWGQGYSDAADDDEPTAKCARVSKWDGQDQSLETVLAPGVLPLRLVPPPSQVANLAPTQSMAFNVMPSPPPVLTFGQTGQKDVHMAGAPIQEDPAVGTHSKAGQPSPPLSLTPQMSPPPPVAPMQDVPPADSAAPAVPRVVYPTGKDAEWEIPWAKLFQKLKIADLEERAGQYAEALMELRVQEDSIEADIGTVQEACNQLLMTAYREALLVRLKVLASEVSAGLPAEVIEAARREADAPQMCSQPPAAPQMFPPPPVAPQMSPPPATSLTMPPPPQLAPLPFPPPAPTSHVLASCPSSRSSNWDVQGAPHAAAGNVEGTVQAPGSAEPGNLYVAGLPESINELQFRSQFANYGTILSCKVMPERRFGFVKLSTKQEALEAIRKLNGFEHNGVKLVVKLADRSK